MNKGKIIAWVIVAISGAVSAVASQMLNNYIFEKQCEKSADNNNLAI